MKKFLAVFLTFAIVLGLCACGGSGENDGSTEPKAAEGLQVGYARESIMPEGSVNIGGAGNQAHRLSDGFLDILYATCIAATEGDTTILLFSTDTLTAREPWTTEARNMINEATGVPQANIQIGGTHTHSAPAVGGGEEAIQKWKPVYMNALVTAAKKALADQAPATLYGATVETEKMAFVRHYLMSDGSYAGSNFGDFNKGIVDYATLPDEEMVLVKMEREGDKKDIMLMNFQAHPCFGGEFYHSLTADFIATTRTAFEQQTGMHFIYFTGASGNQNTSSRTNGENGPHNGNMKDYGDRLAKYAIDAMATMEQVTGTGVKTTQVKLEYKSNDYGQDRLEDARLVSKMYAENGDSTSANGYAKSLGFQSVFECNGIVNCSKYPAVQEMELNVCSFGGIGFIAAPHEMFSNTGIYLKDNSPFAYTVISTTTNHYNNYFPTREAFAYGCYESFTARFASGVAEDVAEQYLQMLKAVQ